MVLLPTTTTNTSIINNMVYAVAIQDKIRGVHRECAIGEALYEVTTKHTHIMHIIQQISTLIPVSI